MIDIIELEALCQRINQSRRKELLHFMKERQGEETKIVALSKMPRSTKEDRGTLCFLMTNRNLYDSKIKDFFVLVDKIATDNEKEIFQKFYSRKENIIEFLGCNNIKTGRPCRVLTDEEKAAIRQLRDEGLGINKISKELKINNRLVMTYCREFVDNVGK